MGVKTFLPILILIALIHAPASAEIFGVGDLPGGDYKSNAFAISGDGSTVVGFGSTDNGYGIEAFRWTNSGSIETLGDLPGNLGYSVARDVSWDGSVIVGSAVQHHEQYSNAAGQAFIWTEEDGMINLGDFTGEYTYVSEAHAVNADGSVIVGSANYEAFRWTEAEGMVTLGDLPGGATYSYATDVSADGSVVVGYGYIYFTEGDFSGDGIEAFRWTEEDGMVGIGDLPGRGVFSQANAVSADGAIIVGWATSENGGEAFIWSEKQGITGLGDLEGGDFSSNALGISADGTTIVGFGNSDDGQEAIVWTEDSGIQSIAEILTTGGIDLNGWLLESATDISADGTLIVGNGISSNGPEAWLVKLDSGLITHSVIANSVNSLTPATESIHGLARESLDTQMQAARHYQGNPDGKFDVYASGFGGEWNSYTAGGTVGLSLNVTEEVRAGGGVFASRYKDDDLKYSGEYELDALGGSLWAGYESQGGGPQLHFVGMLASLDNEIERGYLNGSGLDSSKGDPDGDMAGVMVRAGWDFPISDQASVTPFASYIWTHVEIDDYTETGGGFPAYFDDRKDNADVVKAGLEGEYILTKSVTAWGQAAYGYRFDDDSAGISGEIVGLIDFSLPGFALDDDWFEMDLGFKWQASENFSMMATAGGTVDNDQQPDWRASLGVAWTLL